MGPFFMSELHDGMIVETRAGQRYIVLGDRMVGENSYEDLGDFFETELYDSNLLAYSGDTNWDIVKIFLPTNVEATSELFKDDALELLWERLENEPEHILTSDEKFYLRGVIRPFRDSVSYIIKVEDSGGGEYIDIDMDDDGIILPIFQKGKMYKGMESYKKYTLEELELD